MVSEKLSAVNLYIFSPERTDYHTAIDKCRHLTNSLTCRYHQVHISMVTNCQNIHIKDINMHCNKYDTVSQIFITNTRTTYHTVHFKHILYTEQP